MRLSHLALLPAIGLCLGQGCPSASTNQGNTSPRSSEIGTTSVPTPSLPVQPSSPNPSTTPSVVSAGLTYSVAVSNPLPLSGIKCTLFVYDSQGQELIGMRQAFDGSEQRSLRFALTPGTFRFFVRTFASIPNPLVGGSGSGSTGTSGSIPIALVGWVDLTGVIGSAPYGLITVTKFCDPGPMPGITCTDGTNVDSDGDWVKDADEACPFDANKLSPGVCGCGFQEVLGCNGKRNYETEPNDLEGEENPFQLAANGWGILSGRMTDVGNWGDPTFDSPDRFWIDVNRGQVISVYLYYAGFTAGRYLAEDAVLHFKIFDNAGYMVEHAGYPSSLDTSNPKSRQHVAQASGRYYVVPYVYRGSATYDLVISVKNQ